MADFTSIPANVICFDEEWLKREWVDDIPAYKVATVAELEVDVMKAEANVKVAKAAQHMQRTIKEREEKKAAEVTDAAENIALEAFERLSLAVAEELATVARKKEARRKWLYEMYHEEEDAEVIEEGGITMEESNLALEKGNLALIKAYKERDEADFAVLTTEFILEAVKVARQKHDFDFVPNIILPSSIERAIDDGWSCQANILEELPVATKSIRMSLIHNKQLLTFHWPFMRAKNFIKEIYNYDGGITPKKVNYNESLNILAKHASLSLNELIQMNPIDYAHKYLYNDSSFIADGHHNYVTTKILRDYLLKDNYLELSSSPTYTNFK